MTKFLFSCKICEKVMGLQEKKDVGLPKDEEIRRFGALVVDDTASAILGNIPAFTRTTKLPSISPQLQSQKAIAQLRTFESCEQRPCEM